MDLCMKCSLARVQYSVGKHGVYLSDYIKEMADCKAREFKRKKTQYLKGDCSTTNKAPIRKLWPLFYKFHNKNSYDWLNKFYSCYMATVVIIVNGCGLGIGMCRRY